MGLQAVPTRPAPSQRGRWMSGSAGLRGLGARPEMSQHNREHGTLVSLPGQQKPTLASVREAYALR